MQDDDYEETLAQLESALQVRHIAHKPLITVRHDATPAEAERLADEETLNNLPVVGPDNAIVGVLENVNREIPELAHPSRDVQAVEHSMERLNDRILVESHQSIEGLLEDLLRAPYYQLVVTHGRIDGIVTASDLNKAPVRVMAYATVARLETAMSVAIRTLTNEDDDAAIAHLGDDGAGRVRGHHKWLRKKHLNIALLDATSLKQKGIILARLGVFGADDDGAIEDEFEGLHERLRNPLMHMSPFVGDSIERLRDFADDLARARGHTLDALDACGRTSLRDRGT